MKLGNDGVALAPIVPVIDEQIREFEVLRLLMLAEYGENLFDENDTID